LESSASALTEWRFQKNLELVLKSGKNAPWICARIMIISESPLMMA
jgi:hypothetical protein